MKALRLAIIRTHYSPLDTNTYNIQEIGLAIGLANQNISTDIYSRFKDIYKLTNQYSSNGCMVRLFPLKGLALFGRITFFPGLIKKIINEGYDIVQIHEDSQFMTPFILKACKNSGIKTILYQGIYQEFLGFKWIYQKVMDILYKKSIQVNTELIFAKTTTAKLYLEKKGYSNIKVVPIGLDFIMDTEICSMKSEIKNFVNRFEKILLYIGIIEQRRNVDFIIKILNELKKESSYKFGLIIIGEGPGKKNILKLIEDSKLNDDVLVINKIQNNQIGYIYESADVFLLPSSYEIYGMVVLEALYYGVPVISSQTAGPSDIITNKKFGSCLPLDIKLWKSEIIDFLENTSSANKDTRRKYVENQYNWINIAGIYSNHLKNKLRINKIMNKKVFFLKDTEIDEELIQGFAQNNFLIKILCSNNSSQRLTSTRIVRIIFLHSRYLNLSFKALFQSKNDDIIISFLDVLALYVFLLSKLFRKKRYIIPLNIMYNNHKDLLTKMKRWLFRAMIKSPRVYPTVTSMHLAAYYKKIFDLPNKDFFLVHDCYGGLEKFKKPFIKGNNYVFCGGTNGRDWVTLIKVANLLPHVKFVIVGPSFNTLGSDVPSNIEYHYNIKFLEFQHKIAESSIIALPLITDAPAGLIVLFTAGLMSKPVVTTDNLTLREYITSGENGILVKLGDYKKFAMELDNLVSDTQKQKEFGENLFRKVVEVGSPKAFADNIIDITKQIQLK